MNTSADPVSDIDTNENRGAYESVSPQAGKKRKNNGRGVPLDSSLIMGDPFTPFTGDVKI